MKNTQRGFALLIAVILMTVMLSLGLALGSLGYKQAVIASSAIESQYAFYVADAALECALYADQRTNLFDYLSHDEDNPPGAFMCDGAVATERSYYAYTTSRLYIVERLSLDGGARCADVTVYKYKNPQPVTGVTTYIFSQGYSVPCSTVADPGQARFVARGITARY